MRRTECSERGARKEEGVGSSLHFFLISFLAALPPSLLLIWPYSLSLSLVLVKAAKHVMTDDYLDDGNIIRKAGGRKE